MARGNRAVNAFWTRSDLPDRVLLRIGGFAVWTGLGLEGLDRAMREDSSRATPADPWGRSFMRYLIAVNRGRQVRPREEWDNGGLESIGATARATIEAGLYWEGDSAAAREAGNLLEASLQGARSKLPIELQVDNICLLGQWHLAQGNQPYVATAIRQLQATNVKPELGPGMARYASLCAAILDAGTATLQQRPDARFLLEVADSLARTNIFEVCCGFAVEGANLLLARLWERQNNIPRALAAIRRRSGGFLIAPRFESTFLREEGRLATLAGDSASASVARDHYAGLRGRRFRE